MIYRCIITFLLTGCLAGCMGSGNGSPVDPLKSNGNGPSSPFLWQGADIEKLTVNELRKPKSILDEYEWFPDITEPYEELTESIYLMSSTGFQIYVHIHRPSFASAENPCHGLVLIPGAIQKGNAWHAPWRKSNTHHWTAAGFICADFDVEGRGLSAGDENYYGPKHRADLRSVVEYMASRPDVLPIGVGIVTSSFGITLATSALSAYDDFPVRFLVDLEGAHDRFSFTHWDDPFWVNQIGGHPTTDNEFWSVREAITFMPDVPVPYIRVQSDCDHVFDYFYIEHAIDLINAAVNGVCPYARLNHEQPNILLDPAQSGSYQWENIDLIDQELYMYVIEASTMTFPGE